MQAAGLEDVHRPEHIDLLVEQGLPDRRPHPGPRSKMDHAVVALLRKKTIQPRPVKDIALNEPVAGMSKKGTDILPLEGGIIVGVEIVQTVDRVPLVKQLAGKVGTDETGAAGQEKMHGRIRPFAQ